jgi:hypothetical protein
MILHRERGEHGVHKEESRKDSGDAELTEEAQSRGRRKEGKQSLTQRHRVRREELRRDLGNRGEERVQHDE